MKENRYTKEKIVRDIDKMSLPDLPVTSLIQLKTFPGVWLKCEHENPTGSHKDRAYISMIRAIGHEAKDRILVDYTTGNGGITLAWIAQVLGTQAVVFMPEKITVQRENLIRSYGAKLYLTSEKGYVVSAREAAQAFVNEHPNAILLNQSDNFANQGGFWEVGLELVRQLENCHIKPGAFICAIGTGATFSGIAAALKGKIDNISAIGIEVPEAPTLWSKRRGEGAISTVPSIIGMGAGNIAKNTDERLIDGIELVRKNQIQNVLNVLWNNERLSVGPSTAANIVVAAKIAKRIKNNVVTVSFDRGDRYKMVNNICQYNIKSE